MDTLSSKENKSIKITYWIATAWLSLGMLSTGIIQLIQQKEEVEKMALLGYPAYFLIIIGVWKILGVIIILVPKFPLIKEWAYAGFFITMTGAIFSHLAKGDTAIDYIGPTLLLILTILSWYYRPANKKINFLTLEKEKA